MAVAKTVRDYLQSQSIPYALLPHPHTASTHDTLVSLPIPAERLAKAVVLADDNGYVMAVVPASRFVSVKTLGRKLKRNLRLVEEYRLRRLFRDCELGAIPPLGPAYGLPTVVDEQLVGQPEVYFEAGDHEELVRVSGEAFIALLRQARYSAFTH